MNLSGDLLVQTADADQHDSWHAQRDASAVGEALDPRGLSEGALKKSIAASFNSYGEINNISFTVMNFMFVALERKATINVMFLPKRIEAQCMVIY